MNYIININYMMIYRNNQYIKAEYDVEEIAKIGVKETRSNKAIEDIKII